MPTCARRSVLCGWVPSVQVRQRDWHLSAVSSQLHWVSRLHWSAGHGRPGRVQLVCSSSLWRGRRRGDNALSTARHAVCWRLLPWRRSWTTARPWHRKTGKFDFSYAKMWQNNDYTLNGKLLLVFDDDTVFFTFRIPSWTCDNSRKVHSSLDALSRDEFRCCGCCIVVTCEDDVLMRVMKKNVVGHS